jgi:electron transport complex protein RnfD
MFMPAGAPLYVPIAASGFGILVVKQTFGGLGRNWMHPAMGGVVFALLSWTHSMSRWILPRGMPPDAGAIPPLDALRAAVSTAPAGGTPLSVLAARGYRFSGLDAGITGWISSHLLGPLGLSLPAGSFDVLVGHVAGTIGGVSAPIAALGAIILLRRRAIRWQIPVAYLSSFFVLTLLLGGIASGRGVLEGGPLFQVLSGGILLAAFFAAPDPVTSPLALRGCWLYGVLLGGLTFLMRTLGSLGDGVAAAVVLGNCAVPLLDRQLVRRPKTPRGETAP